MGEGLHEIYVHRAKYMVDNWVQHISPAAAEHLSEADRKGLISAVTDLQDKAYENGRNVVIGTLAVKDAELMEKVLALIVEETTKEN